MTDKRKVVKGFKLPGGKKKNKPKQTKKNPKEVTWETVFKEKVMAGSEGNQISPTTLNS